nr:MAG TPA: hypothetical protein [Ackermannviridae sp.]
MSKRRDRKILKWVMSRLDDLGIITIYKGMNSGQLLKNKQNIIDAINNFYIDVTSYSDTHIRIDKDLNDLLNRL